MRPYDWQQDPRARADLLGPAASPELFGFPVQIIPPICGNCGRPKAEHKMGRAITCRGGGAYKRQEPKDLDLRGEPLPDPTTSPFRRPDMMRGYPMDKEERAAVDRVVDRYFAPEPGVPGVPKAPHWDPDYPGCT